MKNVQMIVKLGCLLSSSLQQDVRTEHDESSN